MGLDPGGSSHSQSNLNYSKCKLKHAGMKNSPKISGSACFVEKYLQMQKLSVFKVSTV